jgi:hypothetical protein
MRMPLYLWRSRVVRALLAAITLAAVTASIVVADEPAPPAADCATYSAFDHFAHLIQCPSNTSLSYYRVRAPIAPYDGFVWLRDWNGGRPIETPYAYYQRVERGQVVLQKWLLLDDKGEISGVRCYGSDPHTYVYRGLLREAPVELCD